MRFRDFFKRIGIISAYINAASYGNSLILKYNNDGILLKAILPFRAFHPPIFIPFSDIRVEIKKILFKKIAVLNVGNPKILTIKIKAKTFKKIKLSTNNSENIKSN